MRLLTKTTLYYITVSLFTFFISGIVIYQLVKQMEESKVKKELNDQMIRFSHDLSHLGNNIDKAVFISGGLIQLQIVPPNSTQTAQFGDTLVFDNIQSHYTPYKRITFFYTLEDNLYKISIYKSLIESNELIERIALIITIIVIVFLMTVYFLNRYFFGRIWSEFFLTLDKLYHFDISSPEKLEFGESMIIEFNQLNRVLKKMIDKISSDFQGLRDFTGNLTHEMQTPLAIIRSKTDLLLQDKDINENQMQLAGEINNETMRLSKLIKALTLFTKLEHNQFPEKQIIDLENLVRSKIEIFEDFIEARSILVNIEIKSLPQISMNNELADILFTNLIKNAIRHNIDNGSLTISINSDKFSIKNTGLELKYDPNLLFERFSKANQNSESLGIGLSLARKICDYYGFGISYSHGNGVHEIVVSFFRP